MVDKRTEEFTPPKTILRPFSGTVDKYSLIILIVFIVEIISLTIEATGRDVNIN